MRSRLIARIALIGLPPASAAATATGSRRQLLAAPWPHRSPIVIGSGTKNASSKSARSTAPHCRHHCTAEMRLAHQEDKCCSFLYRAGMSISRSLNVHKLVAASPPNYGRSTRFAPAPKPAIRPVSPRRHPEGPTSGLSDRSRQTNEHAGLHRSWKACPLLPCNRRREKVGA